MKQPEIFFVAGEPSGDLHTAMLATELRRRSDCRLTGAGGRQMRAAGVQTDVDSSGWGAIGVSEALGKVPYLLLQKHRLLSLIRQRRPALVVLVDFGAFNVRLARALRRFSFHQPILYYFPPASWDKSRRDRSELAALTDLVATPFPWSEELLRKDGVAAHFIGHPVLDRLSPVVDRGKYRQRLGLPAAERYVGLLPGSRRVERALLGPQMRQAASELLTRGNHHFLWSPAPDGAKESLPPSELAGHCTVLEESATIFQAADLVLTSFGTSTLEAAAAECCLIAMYRGTWAMRLQYRLMRIATPYYAMPNIILDRKLVPELVQEEATAPRLLERVEDFFGDPAQAASMRAGLAEVRRRLGRPGAAGRAAELALSLVHAPRPGGVPA